MTTTKAINQAYCRFFLHICQVYWDILIDKFKSRLFVRILFTHEEFFYLDDKSKAPVCVVESHFTGVFYFSSGNKRRYFSRNPEDTALLSAHFFK